MPILLIIMMLEINPFNRLCARICNMIRQMIQNMINIRSNIYRTFCKKSMRNFIHIRYSHIKSRSSSFISYLLLSSTFSISKFSFSLLFECFSLLLCFYILDSFHIICFYIFFIQNK